jgi:hypothetical protein
MYVMTLVGIKYFKLMPLLTNRRTLVDEISCSRQIMSAYSSRSKLAVVVTNIVDYCNVLKENDVKIKKNVRQNDDTHAVL